MSSKWTCWPCSVEKYKLEIISWGTLTKARMWMRGPITFVTGDYWLVTHGIGLAEWSRSEKASLYKYEFLWRMFHSTWVLNYQRNTSVFTFFFWEIHSHIQWYMIVSTPLSNSNTSPLICPFHFMPLLFLTVPSIQLVILLCLVWSQTLEHGILGMATSS